MKTPVQYFERELFAILFATASFGAFVRAGSVHTCKHSTALVGLFAGAAFDLAFICFTARFWWAWFSLFRSHFDYSWMLS
jgi:hypothetical protein